MRVASPSSRDRPGPALRSHPRLRQCLEQQIEAFLPGIQPADEHEYQPATKRWITPHRGRPGVAREALLPGGMPFGTITIGPYTPRRRIASVSSGLSA